MLANKLCVPISPIYQKYWKSGESKTFWGGGYNSSYILRVVIATTVYDETVFHANCLVAISPCFRVLPDCRVSLSGIVYLLEMESKLLRENCPNTEVFFGPYSPVFRLNTEIYSVNLPIQSKYRKIRTRKNFVFGQFPRSDLWSDCHFSKKNVHIYIAISFQCYSCTCSLTPRFIRISSKMQ